MAPFPISARADFMALPTLRLIGFIIGIFLITLAIAMVVPMGTLVVSTAPATCRRSSGRA